jgi:hypothetical protein
VPPRLFVSVLADLQGETLPCTLCSSKGETVGISPDRDGNRLRTFLYHIAVKGHPLRRILPIFFYFRENQIILQQRSAIQSETLLILFFCSAVLIRTRPRGCSCDL